MKEYGIKARKKRLTTCQAGGSLAKKSVLRSLLCQGATCVFDICKRYLFSALVGILHFMLFHMYTSYKGIWNFKCGGNCGNLVSLRVYILNLGVGWGEIKLLGTGLCKPFCTRQLEHSISSSLAKTTLGNDR